MKIFNDESDSPGHTPREYQNNNRGPHFYLSQEQKNNLNKRLPRGFHLIKKSEYEREKVRNERRYKLQDIMIDFNPQKREHNINFNDPFVTTIQQNLANKTANDPRKAKMIIQSIEGRNRQMEKIKNIIQRVRKYNKYPQLASFLNKIGLMQGLNEIQSQNKKGLLTIDTFRERYILVLETAKNNTFEQKMKELIDQMIEAVQCYAQQARKAQFQNNIQSIQKSIDKITRYVSESNWYIRKRKKGDKVDSNYSTKQIMYIGDLLQKLPKAYLIGVLEIVQEKPITDYTEQTISTIKLTELTNRKLKDIQLYVKGKFSMLYRSREKKQEKIRRKRQERGEIIDEEREEEGGDENSAQEEGQNNDNEYSFNQVVPLDEDNQFLEEENQFSELKDKDNPVQNKENNKIQAQQIPQQKKLEEEVEKQPEAEQKPAEEQPQRPLIDESSIDEDDSSDSSMITDEDDSDF